MPHCSSHNNIHSYSSGLASEQQGHTDVASSVEGLVETLYSKLGTQCDLSSVGQ